MAGAKDFWYRMKVVKTGCWEWTGPCDRGGYGRGTRIGGKHYAAHRASWILTFGSAPVGMNVCHTCDNRKCINPGHLFLGTQRDNLRDASAKGRLDHAVSSATRNKISTTQKGRPSYHRGPEIRARMSAAQKTRYARERMEFSDV